jgi:hypothetical protein
MSDGRTARRGPRTSSPCERCQTCGLTMPEGVAGDECPACLVDLTRGPATGCGCPEPTHDRRYMLVWSCRACGLLREVEK